MRKAKAMKKRYWRDVLFFGLGTFLGGTVLGFVSRLVGKA